MTELKLVRVFPIKWLIFTIMTSWNWPVRDTADFRKYKIMLRYWVSDVINWVTSMKRLGGITKVSWPIRGTFSYFLHYLNVLEKQLRLGNLAWWIKTNYLKFLLVYQTLSLRLKNLIGQQKFLITWFSRSCSVTQSWFL